MTSFFGGKKNNKFKVGVNVQSVKKRKLDENKWVSGYFFVWKVDLTYFSFAKKFKNWTTPINFLQVDKI